MRWKHTKVMLRLYIVIKSDGTDMFSLVALLRLLLLEKKVYTATGYGLIN